MRTKLIKEGAQEGEDEVEDLQDQPREAYRPHRTRKHCLIEDDSEYEPPPVRRRLERPIFVIDLTDNEDDES